MTFQRPCFAFVLVLMATFVLPSVVLASCSSGGAENRLVTFCMSERYAGQTISNEIARVLDERLKREGQLGGLGAWQNADALSFAPFLTPLLEYSSDINGGNPDRPLILGGLQFIGDPDLIRKAGYLVGLSGGGDARLVYAPRRFLEVGVGLNYLYSPEHALPVRRQSARACSKNRLGDDWYLDLCAQANRLEKDLIESSSETYSASIAHLFSSATSRHHQVAFGLYRLNNDAYAQDQFTLGFETIHNGGLFTRLDASFGELVPNTLVTRHTLSATIGGLVAARPLRATVGYRAAKGGRLLGVARDDDRVFIDVSYAVHPRVRVSVGYSQIHSTIDYFDESGAVFGVQFTQLRF